MAIFHENEKEWNLGPIEFIRSFAAELWAKDFLASV